MLVRVLKLDNEKGIMRDTVIENECQSVITYARERRSVSKKK